MRIVGALDVLEAELDAMEAADPKLKACGDRLRDIERFLRGEHSRYGIRVASRRRQRLARMRWRTEQAEVGEP